MWSIIHFLDENTVETVPSKWFSKNKCAWPNNKSKRHIADQSYPIPQCFKWYIARALLTDIESFSEANRKCKKALYTTNLSSTETENEVMNKNQKKPKEMLQYNLTKRKKIKLTGYYDNDKFSDNDTADDDDNTVLKIPTYESDDGTSTKEIVEGSNNKELQKNQFSSPSSNQILDKTHSKIELPSCKNDHLEIESFSLPARKHTQNKSPMKRFSQVLNDQYLVVSDRKTNGNTFRSLLSLDLLLSSPEFSPSPKTTKIIDQHNSHKTHSKIESPSKNNHKIKSPIKITPQLLAKTHNPTFSLPTRKNIQNKSPMIRFSQSYNDHYLVVESEVSPNVRSMSPDLLLRSPGFSPSPRTTNTINKIKKSPFKTPSKKIKSARKQLFVNSATRELPKTATNIQHHYRSLHKSVYYKSYESLHNNVKKRSPVKTIKAKKYLSDEQFKDFMQHNIILLKHNMRNLDENLTMLLEQTKKNDSYINNSNDKETIDYSHLDCFFPICDETTLNSIEEQLSVD